MAGGCFKQQNKTLQQLGLVIQLLHLEDAKSAWYHMVWTDRSIRIVPTFILCSPVGTKLFMEEEVGKFLRGVEYGRQKDDL